MPVAKEQIRQIIADNNLNCGRCLQAPEGRFSLPDESRSALIWPSSKYLISPHGTFRLRIVLLETKMGVMSMHSSDA